MEEGSLGRDMIATWAPAGSDWTALRAAEHVAGLAGFAYITCSGRPAAVPPRPAGMWGSASIEVVVDEVEDDEVILLIGTPVGTVHLMGTVRINGRVLHIERAHIHGLSRGALGRAGLNAIGRKLLEEANVDKIIIEGSARSSGPNEGRRPKIICFPRD